MNKKTSTTRYDVAEHLRTPDETAAYLEACLEEVHSDAAFIAKALGDITRAGEEKGVSGTNSWGRMRHTYDETGLDLTHPP